MVGLTRVTIWVLEVINLLTKSPTLKYGFLLLKKIDG